MKWILRCAGICGLVLLGLPLATPSRGSAVNVPADYPSIQGAIDSGADSVIVADGSYDEDLVVGRAVTLLPGFPSPIGPTPFPRVGRLTTVPFPDAQIASVRGFRFRGAVVSGGHRTMLRFEACRFDSGVAGWGYYLEVRGCTVFGGIFSEFSAWSFTGNALFGGGIRAAVDHGDPQVNDNVVVGPAPYGMMIRDNYGLVEIRRNLVTGTVDGINLEGTGGVDPGIVISGNEVHGCSGTGYRGGAARAIFDRNIARNCGGHGMDLNHLLISITNNTIDSVGQVGIRNTSSPIPLIAGNRVSHTGGHGILQEGSVFSVRENHVLFAGGDGLRLAGADTVELNIVGRSAGRGIAIEFSGSGNPPRLVRRNTSYLNGGSGMEVAGPINQVSLERNIASSNLGYGLAIGSGLVGFSQACNDWFSNALGSVSGGLPASTDLAVHPHFCDLQRDDVALSADSPLLNAPACGTIGALGQGCAVAVGVETIPMAQAPSLRVTPQPASGPVVFRWSGLQDPLLLEVYDVAGKRRWATNLPSEASFALWDGDDTAGRVLPAGVYFARLRSGPRELRARVTIVR